MLLLQRDSFIGKKNNEFVANNLAVRRSKCNGISNEETAKYREIVLP